MNTTVFLAVLFAAFLHASWNAVIRAGNDRFQGMLLLTVSQGIMGLAMAAFVPLPKGEVWLWLLASGALHSGYKMFLAAAYRHGDLSRVYPIARGVAPMIVALAGIFSAYGHAGRKGIWWHCPGRCPAGNLGFVCGAHWGDVDERASRYRKANRRYCDCAWYHFDTDLSAQPVYHIVTPQLSKAISLLKHP